MKKTRFAKTLIVFTFEDRFNQQEGHVINNALQEVRNSKGLIVIGYSFPFVS